MARARRRSNSSVKADIFDQPQQYDFFQAVRILERRVELQEQQIEALQASVEKLSETQEFDRQLAAPRAGEAAGER